MKLEKSIAIVWTKYQLHVLNALLRTLNIKKEDVLLILFSKASANNISTNGFYDVINYTLEESASIKSWKQIKKANEKIIKDINFQPKYIFLRNFDSIIGKMVSNYFKNSELILFEEGTASYEYKKLFAYPNDLKETLRTIALRLYFGKGACKIVPFGSEVKKAGLMSSVKPWLKAPYINLDFQESDFFDEVNKITTEQINCEVLILEQPLEQAGLNFDEICEAYIKMMNFLKSKGIDLNQNIVLKKHPSSKIEFLNKILEKTNLKEHLKIVDSKENFEEMYFLNKFPNLKLIISFYSSSLYLAKGFYKEDVEIYAYSTNKLYKNYKDVYKLYENMGISHIRENASVN